MFINRQPIESSSITATGYRAGNLDVQFGECGSIYRYFFIPKKVSVGLRRSVSKGKYFRKHILGKYAYKRLV